MMTIKSVDVIITMFYDLEGNYMLNDNEEILLRILIQSIKIIFLSKYQDLINDIKGKIVTLPIKTDYFQDEVGVPRKVAVKRGKSLQLRSCVAIHIVILKEMFFVRS